MDAPLLVGQSSPPDDAAYAARYADNVKGLLLAVLSSAFIGASFIVKKKGLRRAGSSGSRAGSGGYRYLLEPLWWIGMVTMLVGEIANFVAYIFAPAVLVTPLGALSIIVSAVLAHFILKERLRRMGILGCVLCIVGSTVIVLHAPEERNPSSVEQIWYLATQPAFLSYVASAVTVSLVLILHCSPRYGQTNIMIYLGICSVVGSLTVMSIKAVGIAITLTLGGINQASYFQTWVFAMVSITCIMIQLNYLNKGLLVGLQQEHLERFLLVDERSWLQLEIGFVGCCCLNEGFVSPIGIGYLQYCCCFSCVLCNVHNSDNFGKCNYVQGLVWAECQ